MRFVYTVLLITVVLLSSISSVYGDCSPRAILIPPANVSGYLSCKNGATPSNITINWFKVDGATCDPANYDFNVLSGNRYILEFWINNTVEHDLQICLSAKCGTDTVQAGFSPDGSNPGNCNQMLIFPQYNYALLNDVVFPEPSPATPTPTFTPTSPYSPTPTSTPSSNEFTLNICSGLNMVSMMVKTNTFPNAKSLLQSFCSGRADAVWKYNCLTQSFDSWTSLDTGDGWGTTDAMPIFVNLTGTDDCEWTVMGEIPDTITINMCTGLNMAPLPMFNTWLIMANQLLGDIDNCTAVWKFNREDNCDDPIGFKAFFDISPLTENFFIHNGYAYWVNVSRTGSWTISKP